MVEPMKIIQPSNPLTSDESMDMDKFTDIIKLLVDEAWEDGWGTFTDSQPTTTNGKDIKFPQIAYELKLMQPGKVGSNTRNIKPRTKGHLTVGENGEKISILQKSQIMDCTYRFYIYGNSNKEAEVLSMNFIELMQTYTGFLERQGLRNIVFTGLEKKQPNSQEDIIIYVVQYNVQFEIFYEKYVQTINTIEVTVEDTYSKLKEEGLLPSQKT